MGSGCGAVEEAVEALIARGERVGAVKVRLFRPFSTEALVAAMPSTVRRIAVLDRTKEPGAPGEPLYQDVVTALVEEETAGRVRFDGGMPRVIGGRYGLSSKEFTPAMAAAVFAELDAEEPKNHFTVGIVDDVSGTSLPVDRSFTTEPDDVDPGGVLRPRQRRHGEREQQLDQDHRRRTPTCTRRGTSSSTRRRPGRSPSRTCVSGLARSAPPT